MKYVETKKKIRFNIEETSGALADIGVFLPLALMLISLNRLNPFSVFLVAGIAYIVGGICFGHPIPVQPMKALAVSSLAHGASVEMISMAGIMIGVILLIFSLTNTFNLFQKIFDKPMVRGIQLGLGFILIARGLEYLELKEFLFEGREILLSIGNYSIPLGIIVGWAGVAIGLIFPTETRLPVALLIIGTGILLGIISASHSFFTAQKLYSVGLPMVSIPRFKESLPALFILVIPQIPLTLGNSIFALRDTANIYFGTQAYNTTPRRLGILLGITNILGGLVGAMPLCHGAGGLTAHYRFGARTTGANIIIGTLFILIAFFCLSLPMTYLFIIPPSILGSLLILTGLEHCLLIRDIGGEKHLLFIALSIGSFAIITENLFLGCMVGFLFKGIIRVSANENIEGGY